MSEAGRRVLIDTCSSSACWTVTGVIILFSQCSARIVIAHVSIQIPPIYHPLLLTSAGTRGTVSSLSWTAIHIHRMVVAGSGLSLPRGEP
jgi:hypothetical protein